MRWFLACFVCLIVSSAAQAAVSNTPVFCQTPKSHSTQFLDADAASTYKDVLTAGSNGTKCVGIYVTSSDNAANVVTVQIQHTTTKVGGVAFSVPANSGFTSGTYAVNFMSPALWPGLPIDADGNPYFYLESGDELIATFGTDTTGTEAINVVAICCDY